MTVKNYMEDMVAQVLDDLVAKQNIDFCNCERCRADVIAVALNQLPPQYYVHEKGAAFTKTTCLRNEMLTRVTAELIKAIDKIKARPSH